MAYYFMVEKKKGEYQALNIGSSKYFPVTKKFNKPCAYTLQEIDMFTMMFNDEQELRKHLLLEGILPVQLSTRALSSRNLIKGKYNKVPHDFLYQKDIEYIMEPTRLIELIMKRYYQNDFLFIKKLADNFASFYECSSTAPEVRQFAEISIRENRRNPHLDELDKNGDKLVARLVKLLILEYYEKPDGYIQYKDKVNYRNLHAVIAFINNYDSKLNNKQEISTILVQPKKNIELSAKTESVQITIKETLTNNQIKPSKLTINESSNKDIIVKTKKRSKKKYDIDGQISFKI